MTKQKKNNNDENITYFLPEEVEKLENHYLNKTSCLEPPVFVNRECHLCDKVELCIFEKKYKYYKIS